MKKNYDIEINNLFKSGIVIGQLVEKTNAYINEIDNFISLESQASRIEDVQSLLNKVRSNLEDIQAILESQQVEFSKPLKLTYSDPFTDDLNLLRYNQYFNCFLTSLFELHERLKEDFILPNSLLKQLNVSLAKIYNFFIELFNLKNNKHDNPREKIRINEYFNFFNQISSVENNKNSVNNESDDMSRPQAICSR